MNKKVSNSISYKLKNIVENSIEKNLLPIALIAIVGVFYYNTLGWLIESWLNNAYYSHGFLVPIVSIYIIWNMRNDLYNIEKKQSQTGLWIFTSGIVIHGIGVLSTIRFLSGLSLVITIFGMVLFLFGWEFVNRVKFPILFLLLAIPVPFIDMVAPPAQTVSAVASSNIAMGIGIPVERDGLVLNTPKGSFEVALECSGLKSIISLLTISTIYAFILEGGLLMRSIIVLSSIPIAMAGNILRIISVLEVAQIYGQETAINYFHDFSSLMVFSVAIIGLFSVGRCFGQLKFRRVF